MKRVVRILCIFSFAIVYFSAVCGAAPAAVSPEDCRLCNTGNLQIGVVTSVQEASGVLGDVISFAQGSPSSAYIPAKVVCEYGTIWLGDTSGNADTWTQARVERLIVTREDVYTVGGVHIGDHLSKVIDTYGEARYRPNDIKEYNGVVDQWAKYSPASGLDHIAIGIRDGFVTAIAVSKMAGGL
ncbi:MAG TPA: hypothetical protein DEP57_00325 [Selenomonas sp.]|nr:hypothetical protein [Selenomonas sp.]